MLPWVCTVIEQRWRQNVVRKKSGTRCEMSVSSVIYYCTDPRHHALNLYILYDKMQEVITVDVIYASVLQ